MAAISDPSYNPEAHEKEPTGIPVGIEIEELTKVYNRRVNFLVKTRNILLLLSFVNVVGPVA